mgnify:CR=1 FL=1
MPRRLAAPAAFDLSLRTFAGRRAGGLARLLALGALLGPTRAYAAEYETFIDIDDEDDLLEMNTTGDISAETFDTLVELLRRGVDLNAARREDLFTLPNLNYAQVDAIIRYREEVGFIHDPAMLVAAGVLDATTLKSIASFIYIIDPGVRYAATSGYVRMRAAYSPPDKRAPAMVLDAQMSTLRHLSVGFAGTLTRNRVGDVRYDPDRDALSASTTSPRVFVPKFFAQWDTDQYSVLAGTYRAGFGQRLTFDNTRNPTPNGVYRDLTIYPRPIKLATLCREAAGEPGSTPCAGQDENAYVTPDFRWQETLQGLAVGLKRLELGPGWLQAYAFGSVQSKSIYQYALYDPAICDDPRSDDPNCAAPPIYAREPDPGAPEAKLAYQKLPYMYRDQTAGGNVSYFFNRRSWVGVTGYGTAIKWQTGGKPLDFQEWARVPFGGPFGAVGVNGAWGRRWSDLGVEVARSFDSMLGASGSATTVARGGGGYAAILKHTATWGRHQIETSARYYDHNYANPYARPIAGRDLSEGQSARDEAGFRVRYTGRPTAKTSVRGWLNFWVPPSTGEPQIHLYARVEHLVTRWWQPGVWLEARDKDMRVNGPGQCFGGDPGLSSNVGGDGDVGDGDVGEVGVDYGVPGTTGVGCRGESVKYNIQSAFTPHRKIKLVPRFQHRFVGDPKSDAFDSTYTPSPDAPPEAPKPVRKGYRQDISVWLTITARPTDSLRLRGRLRYQNQAIDDNTYLEQSLWTYLDAGYLIRKTFLVQFRYDLYVWLDKRANTLLRVPSPENRFLVTLEGRF